MPESAVEDKEVRDQGKADTRALPGQNQVCLVSNVKGNTHREAKFCFTLLQWR